MQKSSSHIQAPSNPLRAMRLAKNLSLDQVASRVRLSRQGIIRAEQACYANPPPRLTDFLMEVSDPAAVGFACDDEELVYHLYHKFQTATRKANYGALRPNFNFSEHVPVGVHPFVEWRMQSGIKARIGPAKLYCVHPALLHKYEVQTHLIQSTPGDLYRSLQESGYRSELLDQLEEAFYNFKQTRTRLKINVRLVK